MSSNFILCSSNNNNHNHNNNNNMTSYSYKLKENTDLCHYFLASEKEYGVQCIILREKNKPNDITQKHLNVVKCLFENRISHSPKDVAFIQVAPPAKAFEKFDAEKYKIIIVADAYFKLLQFFNSDWPLVRKRLILTTKISRQSKNGYPFLHPFHFEDQLTLSIKPPWMPPTTLP